MPKYAHFLAEELRYRTQRWTHPNNAGIEVELRHHYKSFYLLSWKEGYEKDWSALPLAEARKKFEEFVNKHTPKSN